MRSYYVYILHCSDGSYYTGVTNDYEERVDQHIAGMDPSCYTYKKRPVKLVYLAEFGDVNEAIAWEKQVKRWSRKKKEALILGKETELLTLAKCQNWTLNLHQIFIRNTRYSIRSQIAKSINLSS